MSISLTILLVVAGVVLLAFGIGSRVAALRFLGGGFALLVAIAGTAAAAGLFWLGQKNHWTSDGPGALFVMIALVVCAIVAAVGWTFVFGVAASVAVPNDALGDARPETKSMLVLLGFACLAIAAAGQAFNAFLGRGRTPHSAPVVGVSFGAQRARLATLDAAGTFVDWDLHSKRETGRLTIPELAGATDFFVGATAGAGFAVANGRAVRFEPFANTPVETIPDARHVAGGAAVVVARDRALLFVPYSRWTKPPYLEMPWPEPILAIAAKDEFVAVADRVSVSLLDGRPRFARQLASVPAPGPISRLELLPYGVVLALDGSGPGWILDVQRGRVEPIAAPVSLAARARQLFVVSGGALSDYDAYKHTAHPLATIGRGARCMDTYEDHVAVGFENGEVVLGTRAGTKLETERLTAKPGER